MQTAIYYPHTRPDSGDVLRTALLLWDEVEFIVPWEGYKPDRVNRDVAEIFEVIGRETVPSDEAKRLAHDRIEEFATRQLPDAFNYRAPDPGWTSPYMYARKLLPETWAMLQELRLVGDQDGRASALRDDTGLVLMSILTDCCAGENKARITDRTEAYARLSNFLVEKDEDVAVDGSLHACVVPVTMRIVEADTLPLRDLINFRKREAVSRGNDLRRLRQRYRNRVEEQIVALAAATLASDRRELQRAFEIDMADDLSDLKEELRLSRREAMSSKDVVFMGLATLTVGMAAAKGLHLPIESVTAAASIPVLGGLINTQSRYAQARHAIITKHPMAYMLELGS
jgi:hypothetical protein